MAETNVVGSVPLSATSPLTAAAKKPGKNEASRPATTSSLAEAKGVGSASVSPPVPGESLRLVPGPVDSRPRAPWSARARQLANEALSAARGLSPDAALQAALKHLLACPELKDARLSLGVRDLGRGAVLFGETPERIVNPASNSKLATAMFALDALGPEFRFHTPWKVDAKGTLYLVGSFDPSLTSDALVATARALRQAGVQTVRGVVLDNGRLEGGRVPKHFEEAGDEDWDYLARPEALSVDRNLVEITVSPSAPGQPASVQGNQQAFAYKGEVGTIGPGEKFKVGVDEENEANGALVRNARGQPIIDVTGNIAADYTKTKVLKMKSPDPVASFGDRLKAALAEAGIVLEGEVREGVAPPEAVEKVANVSKPLRELLQVSIAESNAFDLEMLLLAASARRNATAAGPAESPAVEDGTGLGHTSLEQSVQQLNAFLHTTLALSPGLRMENGSGIGRANFLCANDVLAILQRAHDDARYRPLLDALARPGQGGTTLVTRMLGTPAEGRLRAKTGTLTGAVALSGTVVAQDGRELGFSALVNRLPPGQVGREAGRAVMDALGIVLASLSPEPKLSAVKP